MTFLNKPMNRTCRLVFSGFMACVSPAVLGGCSSVSLLHPKGPVGARELEDIGVAFALMLIVVIPVTFLAYWFPRRYDASNPKGDYAPTWSHSAKIDLIVWLIPGVIVTALGVLTWTDTHRLDPARPIEAAVKPIDVDVVSLDWKWLFIYPDRDIATVNELVLPIGVPVNFRLTSDTVVTDFFIPQLGSQIYAMAGRKSRLHLLASQTGVYVGQNQQFSGRGYSDMNFKVFVTSARRFKTWVRKAKKAPDGLDLARFETLRRPSEDYPATVFSSVRPDLFDEIVAGYHAAAASTAAADGAVGSFSSNAGVVQND